MKDKEAQFMYKCRLCNKTFPSVYSGTQSADKHLINAIHNITVDNQCPPPMITIHICARNKTGINKMGIADLMGFKIK